MDRFNLLEWLWTLFCCFMLAALAIGVYVVCLMAAGAW